MDKRSFHRAKDFIIENKDKNNTNEIKKLFLSLSEYLIKTSKSKVSNVVQLMQFIGYEVPNVLIELNAFEHEKNKDALYYLLKNESNKNISGWWLSCLIKCVPDKKALDLVKKETLFQVDKNTGYPLAWSIIGDLKLIDKTEFGKELLVDFIVKVSKYEDLIFNDKGTLNYLFEQDIYFDFNKWDWDTITATPSILNTLAASNNFVHANVPCDMYSKNIFKIKPSVKTFEVSQEICEKVNDYLLKNSQLWFNEKGPCSSVMEISFLHNYSITDHLIDHLNLQNDYADKNLLEAFIIYSKVSNFEKLDQIIKKHKKREDIVKTMTDICQVFKDIILYREENIYSLLSHFKKSKIFEYMPQTNYKYDKAIYLFTVASQFNQTADLVIKKNTMEKLIIDKTFSIEDKPSSSITRKIL